MILTPVLVLNASYEPIAVCLARRALTMIAKGVARVEESHDLFVHREIRLPSVIRLRDYRRVPIRRHTVSRRNIFIRDRHTCQYCKQCFPGLRLTLDHVIPKSRGGLSLWENLVTSCRECNEKKANRTPAEAGMPLAVVPRAMSLHSARHVLRRMGEEDPKWRPYLYFRAFVVQWQDDSLVRSKPEFDSRHWLQSQFNVSRDSSAGRMPLL